MANSLYITKGSGGWGGPSDHRHRAGQEGPLHHRGHRPDIVDRMVELSGMEAVDGFKTSIPDDGSRSPSSIAVAPCVAASTPRSGSRR